MDSRKLARIARAVLAGDFDFEAPSRRTSSSVALFLAGLGTGIAVGMLFSPAPGEEIRSKLGDRARDGFERAKSKTQEFTRRVEEDVERAKEPGSETRSGRGPYDEKISAA